MGTLFKILYWIPLVGVVMIAASGDPDRNSDALIVWQFASSILTVVIAGSMI